jgi:hypothetical protein
MSPTRRNSVRIRRGFAAVAATVTLGVVGALSFPLAAIAQPIVLWQGHSADNAYSAEIDQDGYGWSGYTFTVTNNSAQDTTFGLEADLATEGVPQKLWEDPVLSTDAQVDVAAGASYSESVPTWPGITVSFYADIFGSLTPVGGSYRTPGAHLRFVDYDQVPGDDSTLFGEIGPAVTWSPTPVAPGAGLLVSASGLTPGPVEAYLDSAGNFDWVDGQLVGIPSDPNWDLGGGTVAPDGTLQLDSVVPVGTPTGAQYQIMFENSDGFGVHLSTDYVDVEPGTPARLASGSVSIAGGNKLGVMLGATPSGFDAATTSYLYQWFADGTAIGGATSSTFTVTDDQVGREITVQATGFAPGYIESAPVISPPTKAILTPLTFSATTVPVISGTAQVGQKLTSSVADWTPATGFSYEWDADGVAVGTLNHYVLTPAELGKTITLTVTSAKNGYEATSTTSAGLGPVIAGVITLPNNTNRPSISGKQKVGGTVTVKLGNWNPDPTFVYQWYIDGVAVPGGTTSSLVVPATVGGVSTVGSTLSVSLVASSPGYGDYPITVSGTAIS